MMLLAVGGLWFQSCDKDDENRTAGNEFVQQAFEAKYPGATGVDWGRSGGYYVAEFQYRNSEREAWFDARGTWLMTETELAFAALPQAVRTAFLAGPYTGWPIEDVDLYERPDLEDIYVIEVEQANQEVDLVYMADGTLLKTLVDTGNDPGHYLPVTLPASAKEYIAAEFPGALIVDTDLDEGLYEVEILHASRLKEVWFNSAWNWVRTQWEVAPLELPQAVTAAIEQAVGSSYLIDEADYVHTAGGDWYLIEIEQGSNELLLTITPDGRLMQ